MAINKVNALIIIQFLTHFIVSSLSQAYEKKVLGGFIDGFINSHTTFRLKCVAIPQGNYEFLAIVSG